MPHLGTFLHLLSADVFARYLRLKGEDVVAVTGSDEHGTPIEVEAIKRNIPPRQLTDQYHNLICDLLRRYHIEFDNYTRTESPTHIKFVQSFYAKVHRNGYVYTQNVTLPYCPRCERYLPDRFIEGTCPHCSFEDARGDQCENCGRILEPLELRSSRCVFCGSAPVPNSSTHWFFDLPKFTNRLSAYLESNKQLPDNARNFSRRWIDEGLKPRALTRDNKWGIPAPFPDAQSKIIYVWLEAVLGYVSATVELGERRDQPDLWKKYWFDKETRNVHFIGKDNIPFHTIIFPALLLATNDDYVLPWQVSSTEFILFDGQKFSKSRGIGVWIDEALEIAPAEYWRYVLIALRPETRDGNFTWREFESHINADLNDVLGNFVHRTLTFIESHLNGAVPAPGHFDETDKAFVDEIRKAPQLVGEFLDEFRLRDALNVVIRVARNGNEYLSRREPWHRLKDNPVVAHTTLYLCAELVRTLSILIAPFLPETAQKIWKQLGLTGSVHEQSWLAAGELGLRSKHAIGKPEPLFSKVAMAQAIK